ARIFPSFAAIASAMARRAAFFLSVVAVASGRTAARARAPSSSIRAATPFPASLCAFSILSLHHVLACGSRRQHQIVAMYHRRACLIAEGSGDLAGLESGDLYGIGSVIGNQPAGSLTPVRAENGNRIAAREVAVNARDAGGQQALALKQR